MYDQTNYSIMFSYYIMTCVKISKLQMCTLLSYTRKILSAFKAMKIMVREYYWIHVMVSNL